MDYFNTTLHEAQQRYLKRQLGLLIDMLAPEDTSNQIEYKQISLADGKTMPLPIWIQITRCSTPGGWAYRIAQAHKVPGRRGGMTGSGWYSQSREETIERAMSLICYQHGRDKEDVRKRLAFALGKRMPDANKDFVLVLTPREDVPRTLQQKEQA